MFLYVLECVGHRMQHFNRGFYSSFKSAIKVAMKDVKDNGKTEGTLILSIT